VLKIRLSATNDSLSAIFKDWQIKALAVIPSNGGSPVSTKYVWDQVNQLDEINISRASVINFLEDLHKYGLLRGILATGKGGKRHNYEYPIDRQDFNTRVSTMLLGAIIDEYPGVDMMKIVRLVNGGAH